LPEFSFLFREKLPGGTANVLMIAGVGQLVIFYVLLFYLYKGKIKDASKD